MTERNEFFNTIRQALGPQTEAPNLTGTGSSALGDNSDAVSARSQAIQAYIDEQSGPLMDSLSESATGAGWKVARFDDLDKAGDHIVGIVRDVEANLVVRSRQDVLESGIVEAWLASLGVDVVPMALGEHSGHTVDELRSLAERADIGITGVDYAIAETGSCVLIPSAQVSRLVSLLPPIHIAIVQRGQVLPTLDELFTMRRRDFLEGNLGSYMNLISGPSRSADIEYTLVTGVHWPGEVHMILVG